MILEFDPNLYARAPVADVPSAYALGASLLTTVPREEKRDSLVRGAARNLRSDLTELGDAWSTASKLVPVDRRAADTTADTSWRAVHWALESVALVRGTTEDDARADRAQSVLGRVFPSGLDFTQKPFNVQWAHADRLLKDLDRDGLAREIDRLIGSSYLAFVRRAHTRYGEVLRITEAADDPQVNLREPLRKVQLAIQHYVYTLFATYSPFDAKNHALLRKALAPIDAHRAAQSRAPAPSEPSLPAEPSEPAPMPPPPPDPLPNV